MIGKGRRGGAGEVWNMDLGPGVSGGWWMGDG